MIVPTPDRAAYEAIDAVNFSTLKSLFISPLQYFHDLKAEREVTEALRVGLAGHARLLEPDTWDSRFVVYREPKNKGEGSKTRWKEFQLEAAAKGWTILSEDEYDRALGCADAVLRHPIARRYFENARKEQTITWTCPVTGIRCKGRVDAVNGVLTEFKTTRHATPRLFQRDCASLYYVEQSAWYRDGLEYSGADVAEDSRIVAVQSEPPHDVGVYLVPGHLHDVARDRYQSLLIKLAHCRKTDCWPGALEGEIELEMPTWWYPHDDLALVMPDNSEIAI